MWNETGTFRVEFSRKIQNGSRFKMRWNLFRFVSFFELIWNVSTIPDETEQNWQPCVSMLPCQFPAAFAQFPQLSKVNFKSEQISIHINVNMLWIVMFELCWFCMNGFCIDKNNSSLCKLFFFLLSTKSIYDKNCLMVNLILPH